MARRRWECRGEELGRNLRRRLTAKGRCARRLMSLPVRGAACARSEILNIKRASATHEQKGKKGRNDPNAIATGPTRRFHTHIFVDLH